MERRKQLMSKYLISLTPLGKYFFGGDMTFKVGDNRAYNERFSSYIIESNRFPQQTSLLGMLRYLILSNDKTCFDNGKKVIINKEKAKEVIGSEGFTVNKDYQANDYKFIKSLSFCSLAAIKKKNMKQILLPMPKDYGYSVTFDPSVIASFNNKQMPLPKIDGYDPKNRKPECFLGAEKTILASDIFIEDNRIGIDKRYDGKTDNNKAFYKQKSFRLGKNNSQYCFVFEAEVDKSIDLTQPPYNGAIVTVGGDSSTFLLTAVLSDKKIVCYSEDYNDNNIFQADYKLILLSEAYLEKSEAMQATFSLSETVPFRFLKTSVETENYTVLSKVNLRNNDKYYLYQRGTVFYCNETQLSSMKAALEKDCFTQIGYNHYQIIQNKK